MNFTHLCRTQRNNTSSKLKSNIRCAEEHTKKNGKHLSEMTISIVAVIATFPFIHWCSHHGARHLFLIMGFLSCIATACQVPILQYAAENWWLTVIKATAQGMAYATDFVVMGVVCTRWAALSEAAIFISTMSCVAPLGSVLTFAASGLICDKIGWQWISYFHSLCTFIVFLCWAAFYTDAPQDSRFVSPEELKVIFDGKTEAHKIRVPFVPYIAILRSKTVWTVWLNAFTELFSAYFLIIFGPSYLSRALHYNIISVGLIMAIINAIHIPVKLSAGFLSDYIRFLTNRQKLWIFNSVALLCPAAFYLIACFVPTDKPMITVILFGLIMATIGFNAGGFYKCAALISRQYAEVVISFTQFIKCAVFFIAPLLMNIFVPHECEPAKWHTMFYLIATSMIVANTAFLLMQLMNRVLSQKLRCQIPPNKDMLMAN
ncbi:major facilitator superfamily domain-containing protein [Ditylenchus destructor]|uniref:Major facilitator superfamily domain-containing protein n=1 Tax=Ditylenchus destructor TaxID=166010 RepID=A0AAD4R7C7_9BILA|nr:major facilitator superfamily domain-containing protein [Ditylenchus destructor]